MSLRDVLSVTPATEGTFRSQPAGTGFQFGGLTLGCALRAAAETVGPEMVPKSLHAYFLRPGEWGAETDLEVERLSDGRAFAARVVTVKQAGRTLAVMTASFHTPGSSLDWQASKPVDIAEPESLEPVPITLPLENLIEVRPLNAKAAAQPTTGLHQPTESLHPYWARALGDLGTDPKTHYSALTFISDYLVILFVQAAGVELDKFSVRTLDQSVWFHRPTNAEDWMLFSTDPVSVANGRGLTNGAVHDREGRLVASFTQETIVIA
ncbi:acyl-CoA thioesterase [Jatrophihabitans sp. DSM 45814]